MADTKTGKYTPEWHLLGEGACGTVHATQDAEGTWYAAKTLNGVSINRNLMERIIKRVQESWVEAGCAPVLSVDWTARPVCMISPLYADVTEAAGTRVFVPRSLQRHLAEHTQKASTWDTINKLADSIAASHRLRIAHGNLKPGNVFFDKRGRILLTDYAQGLMPEVSHLPFSDALLYTPPEQLIDPSGYLEEKGYRWDVFAFGVMAYRLLEGAFPRCDATFSSVAPPSGTDRRSAIEADRAQIAENLLQEPIRGWSTRAANDTEQQRRDVILRCLEIDPGARFKDVEDIVQELAAIRLQEELNLERDEVEAAMQQERENLEGQVVVATKKRNKAYRRLALIALIALAGWGAWAATEAWRQKQNSTLSEEIDELKVETKRSQTSEQRALAAEKSAKDELSEKTAILDERLRASREVGDRLFSWVLEKGADDLPALMTREERAQQLIEYFKDFIEAHQDKPGWEKEIERARLQIIELQTAIGDATAVNEALPKLESNLRELEMLDPEMVERLLVLRYRAAATNLDSDQSAAAESLYAQIVSHPVGQLTRRGALVHAQAAAELARRTSARGEYETSQQFYSQAISSFNQLGTLQPGLMLPQAEIPQLQIEGALIAEGQDATEEAIALRTAAAEGLAELAKARPDYAPGRIQLAALHRRVAEGKLLQGMRKDCIAALARSKAELAAAESTVADDSVLDYRLEKVAIDVVEAELARDRGRRTDALALLQAAESDLAALAETDADEVNYRRALLACAQSRLLTEQGDSAAAMAKSRMAFDHFQKCLASDTWSPLRKVSVSRELAILCTDAAYTAEMDNQKKDAMEWYDRAGKIWSELAAAAPGNEEFAEAAKWCARSAKALR